MTRPVIAEAEIPTNAWVDALLARVAATPRDRVEAVVEFDLTTLETEYRFTIRKAVAR